MMQKCWKGEKMKVILENSVYEMNRKQFLAVSEVAKKAVKCGIYAIEKDGLAEMKKETFDSKEDLRKAVAEYKIKGFNVYYNL